MVPNKDIDMLNVPKVWEKALDKLDPPDFEGDMDYMDVLTQANQRTVRRAMNAACKERGI